MSDLFNKVGIVAKSATIAVRKRGDQRISLKTNAVPSNATFHTRTFTAIQIL